MAGLDEVDQRGWPLPSRRVTARLRPDEQLVAATRQHWVVPAWALAVPTAVAGVLIWLAGALPPGSNGLLDLGWVVWLGLLLRMAWRLWGWSVAWFAVTDERLLLSYGRLTKKLAMMPLSKVTDMTYVRTSAGQALGFGEFVLESAGQDQALHRVRRLPRSQQMYDLIYDQLARRDRARQAGREARAGTVAATPSSGRAATPRPATESAGVESSGGGAGTEVVRVTRSARSTPAGRTPGPVRERPDEATQVVARDAWAGRSPTRPGGDGSGRRGAAVGGGSPRAGGTANRGDGGGAGFGDLARRAWSAVRGGSVPELPTAPPASERPERPARPARPAPSGGSGPAETSTARQAIAARQAMASRQATASRQAPSSRQAPTGERGGARRRTAAARLWAGVRGGDGTRL